MSRGEDFIRMLREAIRIWPDIVLLRQHLAGMLLSLGQYEEGEGEPRAALALAPENTEPKYFSGEALGMGNGHCRTLLAGIALCRNHG